MTIEKAIAWYNELRTEARVKSFLEAQRTIHEHIDTLKEETELVFRSAMYEFVLVKPSHRIQFTNDGAVIMPTGWDGKVMRFDNGRVVRNLCLAYCNQSRNDIVNRLNELWQEEIKEDIRRQKEREGMK